MPVFKWLAERTRIIKYDRPRLRMRHMPFSIGIEERGTTQWSYCMAQALKKIDLELLFTNQLMTAFIKTANFMHNRAE